MVQAFYRLDHKGVILSTPCAISIPDRSDLDGRARFVRDWRGASAVTGTFGARRGGLPQNKTAPLLSRISLYARVHITIQRRSASFLP